MTDTPDTTATPENGPRIDSETLKAFMKNGNFTFYDKDAAIVECILTDDSMIVDKAHCIILGEAEAQTQLEAIVSSGHAVALCKVRETDAEHKPRTGGNKEAWPLYDVIEIMRPTVADFINPDHPPVITRG